ncbi:MAG TPA: flippase [Candidatus Bathyarchaeia archaeon]|nr:flippase [Candidatus Bathyarchaeia archaeon]
MSFVFFIYIARLLPVSEFGSYITIISFVSLFSIFTDFGINTVIIREGAKEPEHTHHLISNAMGLETLLSVGSIVLLTACMFFTPYSFDVKLLIVLASSTLLMSGLGSLFRSVFNIYQDMKYISFYKIIERAVFVIFSVILIALGFGIIGIIYATIVGAFVNMLLSFVKSRQIHHYKLNFKPIFDRNIVGPAVWFGLAALLGTIWQRIDTIMISLLIDMRSVGLYTPAVNFVGIGDMAVVAVTGAFFPVLSKAVHKRRITKKELFRYVLYFTIAGIIIIVMTFTFANQLIYYTVGPKFAESVDFLNILIVGFAIGLIAVPTALLLDATNNQKVHVLNATYMSLANFGLNLYLIPIIGAIGAAYSTSISRILGTVLGVPIALYFLKRSNHI